MGILKYAIIGVAAFVLAPMPPESETAVGAAGKAETVETHEVVSVVLGTVSDLASFCTRQPQTCALVSDFASVAEAKAKYSVRLAYEWANGSDAGDPKAAAAPTQDGLEDVLRQTIEDKPETEFLPTAQPEAPAGGGATLLKSSGLLTGGEAAAVAANDTIITGSLRKLAEANEDAGTNTLTIEDLVPDWRGPSPENVTG
jgi:hypothetical protein